MEDKQNLDALANWERADEILKRVFASGCAVSKGRLAGWHRKGLLPRPRRKSLGRKGSESFYPPGTTKQVLELCALLKANHRLRVPQTAWHLCWKGYYGVDMKLVRDFLVSVAREWDLRMQRFIDKKKPSGLSDEARSYIAESGNKRLTPGLEGQIRRSIRRKNYKVFVEFWLEFITGNFKGYSLVKRDAELEIVLKALGIDPGKGYENDV